MPINYDTNMLDMAGLYQRGQEQGRATQLSSLQQKLAQGDKSALAAINALSPEMGGQYTAQQNKMNEQLARGAAAVLNAPADQQAAVYAAQRKKAEAMGADLSSLPEIFSPEAIPQLQAAQAYGRELEKPLGEKYESEEKVKQREFERGENVLNRAVQYSAQQVQRQLGDPFANALAAMQGQQYATAQQTAQAMPQAQALAQRAAALSGEETGGINVPIFGNLFGKVKGEEDASAILGAMGMDQKDISKMSAKEKVARAKLVTSQQAQKAAGAQDILSGMQGAVGQAIARSAQLGSGATIQPLIKPMTTGSSSKFW